MPIVTWSPSLNVGIDRFDADHRSLVELMNRFHEAIERGQGWAVLGPALGELERYSQDHFAREEQAMRDADYPGLEDHMAQHQMFVRKLEEVQADYDAGNVEASRKLTAVLQTWLLHHITLADHAYAPHLKATPGR